MRALQVEGNVAEALTVESLRQRLREELGAAPGDQTRALYRSLLG